jgi:hypothetical protein
MFEMGECCLLKLRDMGGPTEIRAIEGIGADCYMQFVEANA